MHTPTLDTATIDRHMRHAHTIRSQAVLRTLSRVPAMLGRSTRALTAVFA